MKNYKLEIISAPNIVHQTSYLVHNVFLSADTVTNH